MHSMHDEPMMEDNEQPSLGLAINEEQTDVQTACSVEIFADTCPQEVRGLDGIALHEVW